MQRLTRQLNAVDGDGIHHRGYIHKDIKPEDFKICNQQMAFKLGQLEDIEQQLGIELITLFRALNKGFWYKREGKIDFCVYAGYYGKFIVVRDNELNYSCYIGDYGITWALKEGELK